MNITIENMTLEHLEKIRTDLNNSENKYMTTILNGVIK